LSYFKDWNKFELTWLFGFTILGTWLCIHWGESAVGIVSFLTNIWCVILVTKGKILNYPIGIIGVVTYAWVAYNRQLYGDMQLNLLYYLPMSFYGWWVWNKNRTAVESTGDVEIKFMNSDNRCLIFILISISVMLYAGYLENIGGSHPWKDSTTTILFVVAMFLMARRYMEQWILWIIGDIVEVVMWFTIVSEDGGRDIGALLMWSAFLINACYGLWNWVGLYKKQSLFYREPFTEDDLNDYLEDELKGEM
jgi:nicotinamide mononucleotide transporter